MPINPETIQALGEAGLAVSLIVLFAFVMYVLWRVAKMVTSVFLRSLTISEKAISAQEGLEEAIKAHTRSQEMMIEAFRALGVDTKQVYTSLETEITSLRALFDTMRNGNVDSGFAAYQFTNDTLVLRYINAKALTILERSADQMSGQPQDLQAAFLGLDNQPIPLEHTPIYRAASTCTPVEYIPLGVMTRNRDYVWVLASAYPVICGDGSSWVVALFNKLEDVKTL